jgi:hypothetical protein
MNAGWHHRLTVLRQNYDLPCNQPDRRVVVGFACLSVSNVGSYRAVAALLVFHRPGLGVDFRPDLHGPTLLEQLHAPNAEYLIRSDPMCSPFSPVAALGSPRSAATARGPKDKAPAAKTGST